jgi:hypothetical protein
MAASGAAGANDRHLQNLACDPLAKCFNLIGIVAITSGSASLAPDAGSRASGAVERGSASEELPEDNVERLTKPAAMTPVIRRPNHYPTRVPRGEPCRFITMSLERLLLGVNRNGLCRGGGLLSRSLAQHKDSDGAPQQARAG